jgi:pSer/pThr/pTyr-binding forkhead associated (FHA) protein
VNDPSVIDPRVTETRTLNPADAAAILDAERTGQPFLHWRTDAGNQRLRVLDDEKWRLTIGRHTDSDIALTWDAEISRAHALLERVGDEWTVVDDGLSRNGSFVNGNRLLGRQRLHDRDRLCFGQTQLVYREPQPADTEESTARVSDHAAVIPLSTQQRKVLIALCRPVNESSFATPATNKQIADEVFLSIDAVKAHLRILFERFGLSALPQNEKRAKLAAAALVDGILKPHDF